MAKTSGATTDEIDQMFDEQAGQVADTDEFVDMDDLLDEVEEDDAEAWVPKEKGEGIVGKLVKIDQTRSDFANDGEDPFVPTWTLENPSGKFRIIGYASMLKREMIDKNPAVGDVVAVKYFGEKPLKTGKFQGRPFKYFGVAVRRS